MKTYIHKKLGWKAVESNPNTKATPVTRNYKIYKSEDSKSYTLRSSLEIEDSEDWIHEEYYNILLNWFQSKFPSKKTYNQQLENVRKKIKEAEESGFSDGDLWDKDYSSDNAGEFTVLEYSYDGSSWVQAHDFSESYHRTGFYTWEYKIKHNGVSMETPPTDFKDRKILKVRRESDGETFSLGDYFLFGGECVYPPQEIDNILIREDGKCMLRSKDNLYVEYLSQSKKAYKVEDGYVCEGDKVYTCTESHYGVEYWTERIFKKDMLNGVTGKPYGIKIYKNPPLNTEILTPPAETVKLKQNKDFCEVMKQTGVHKFRQVEDGVVEEYCNIHGVSLSNNEMYVFSYRNDDIDEMEKKYGIDKWFKYQNNALNWLETKQPPATRIFNSTKDAELLATLENRIDELSNKYEISLKFYSDLLALVEQYKNKIGK